MSSFLTSAGSDFTFTPRMHKISTGPNALIKRISLPAYLPDAVSLQSASLYLSAIDHGLPCHSNGGVVSRFPSTVCFTFGYIRYCIRSIWPDKCICHLYKDDITRPVKNPSHTPRWAEKCGVKCCMPGCDSPSFTQSKPSLWLPATIRFCFF